MIRFFFTRLILPLIIFWLLRMIFKSVSDSMRGTVAPRPAPTHVPPSAAGGELKRDPVCGTYVSPNAALSCTVKGEAVYFCSAECRDKFRA